MHENSKRLNALSSWVDEGNTHRDAEAKTWGRLAKVSEEGGEVIAAYIGFTGQNPRKGVCASISDVEEELLDVAITALGALAHLRGNSQDVMQLLDAKLEKVAKRAGLE